ncbi:hypothetical protein EPA93_05770 [Ktedonosporobacter rubrisoli]|uniref:Uncharacterized protein n=1 Tax=Ktedonosporobacter rubrisoli TaxID=2509675 RepID=A0A4P6JK41_KTERU|nr:hypothetical protein [Ktedonosporobacter rubrisoli]QBD75537.1 hypothetical protein EPA93_05770 [Ktedonosporobacter rubrisoli]
MGVSVMLDELMSVGDDFELDVRISDLPTDALRPADTYFPTNCTTCWSCHATCDNCDTRQTYCTCGC